MWAAFTWLQCAGVQLVLRDAGLAVRREEAEARLANGAREAVPFDHFFFVASKRT